MWAWNRWPISRVRRPNSVKAMKDAHEDVEECEPEKPHSKEGRRAAKSDDRGGADESGPIGEGHHHGVNLATRHQVIRGGMGCTVSSESEVRNGT